MDEPEQPNGLFFGRRVGDQPPCAVDARLFAMQPVDTAVVDARLQSARDQFEARLAAIKHDLLLGQAELARPLGDDGSAASFRSLSSEDVGAEELTAQAEKLRESLAGFFEQLYPPREGAAPPPAERPAAALEQSRRARERALAHVQALKEQVSSSADGRSSTDASLGGPPRAVVIPDVESSEDTVELGAAPMRRWAERPSREPERPHTAGSFQMRAAQLARRPEAPADQRERYGSLSARRPRGRYRKSAWSASNSNRFAPLKEMSDPGRYDPPAGMRMYSNAKFPGGQPLPTAAFDSTSKRFPDHGSIWRPTSEILICLCSLSAAPVLTCVRARCLVQATTALALGGTILSMPMIG